MAYEYLVKAVDNQREGRLPSPKIADYEPPPTIPGRVFTSATVTGIWVTCSQLQNTAGENLETVYGKILPVPTARSHISREFSRLLRLRYLTVNQRLGLIKGCAYQSVYEVFEEHRLGIEGEPAVRQTPANPVQRRLEALGFASLETAMQSRKILGMRSSGLALVRCARILVDTKQIKD